MVPDFEKIQIILNHVVEHMNFEVDFIAMGGRFSWVAQSSLEGNVIGEFAVLPLTEVFTKAETLEFFKEYLDSA